MTYRITPSIRKIEPVAAVFIASTALLACAEREPAVPAGTVQGESPTQVTTVDDTAIGNESLVSEWLAYGGTHYERRYSPLTDVNAKNVSELRVD